jgi:hypothetical protein
MSLERYFTTLTGHVRDTSQVTWAGRAGQGLQTPDQAPNPGEAKHAGDLEGSPEALLRGALRLAPEHGIPVADLVAATGMSHRWVNYRLRTLADAGQTIQIKHGIWRVTNPGSDAARGTPLPGLGQVQSRVCDEADAVGAPDGFCPPGI